MPVHDWTRLEPGDFHDFHQCWIVEIRNALNRGLLPQGYIAMAEQVTGRPIPDVVALHTSEPEWEPRGEGGEPEKGPSLIADGSATVPPRIQPAQPAAPARPSFRSRKFCPTRHACPQSAFMFQERDRRWQFASLPLHPWNERPSARRRGQRGRGQT
jgi:hypothetical protein